MQTRPQRNHVERKSNRIQPQSLRSSHHETQKPKNHRTHLQQRKNGHHRSTLRRRMSASQPQICQNHRKNGIPSKVLRVQGPERSSLSRREIPNPSWKARAESHVEKNLKLLNPIYALTLSRFGLPIKAPKNSLSHLCIGEDRDHRSA